MPYYRYSEKERTMNHQATVHFFLTPVGEVTVNEMDGYFDIQVKDDAFWLHFTASVGEFAELANDNGVWFEGSNHNGFRIDMVTIFENRERGSFAALRQKMKDLVVAHVAG